MIPQDRYTGSASYAHTKSPGQKVGDTGLLWCQLWTLSVAQSALGEPGQQDRYPGSGIKDSSTGPGIMIPQRTDILGRHPS